MKNLINITLCLLIASLSLTSCGDDEPSVATSREVSFADSYGKSLSGIAYVFPYATNYNPTTFLSINTALAAGKIFAEIETTDGEKVKSLDMLPIPKDSYCNWDNINPGKYYIIGYAFEYVTGSGMPYMISRWKAKVVDIEKNSTGKIIFTFSSENGYQGED